MTAAVAKGAKENLPDVGKKGSASDSIVSFAAGNNFNAWGFKVGTTATEDMVSILKKEKGANAPELMRKKGTSGKVKVVSSVKGKSKASASKSGALKAQSKKIMKATPGGKDTGGMKKSTAKLASGKTPKLPSPGVGASAAGTPGFNKQ